MQRAVIIAVIAILAFGGCGSSATTGVVTDESGDSTPGALLTTTPSAPSPAETTVVVSDPLAQGTPTTASSPTQSDPAKLLPDQHLAEAAVLTIDDLPEGWTQNDDEDENDNDSVCFGSDLSRSTTGLATSTFSNDSAFSFFGAEVVYATDEAVERMFQELRDDAALECLVAEMASDDPSSSEAEIQRFSISPLGDQAIGLRLELDEASFSTSIDAAFIQVGRVAMFVSMVGVSDELRDHLIDTIISRLADA